MVAASYQYYKETGLEWCKEVPEHWDLIKVSHFAKLQSGENITSLMITPVGDYPVYGGNGLRGYYKEFTHDGDYILIGRQGALCGNINYASGKFWASEHAVVVTPDRVLSRKWLGEVLRVMDLGQYSVSAAQPGISVEMITKLKVPFPPYKEQVKIAKFLDYKTEQIDRLIEKKKALIDKLKERRIAIITQAVTRGLDLDAPMKDSEVDWLGEVPAHWGLTKVRYLFSFGRGLGITKSDLKDEGTPCLNYGEIHSKYGFEVIPERQPLKCVPENYLQKGQSSLLKAGDFVYADTSEDIEGSGNFAYLNSDTPTFAGYHTVIERLETNDIPRFLAYQFDSILYRYQIRKSVTGVKVYSITQQILKGCYVWLPPIEEQQAIVEYLDSHLGAIDKMLEVNKKSIERLNEYRTALVTAAVTGKVDVRNIDFPEEG